jgi:hypothetical protein
MWEKESVQGFIIFSAPQRWGEKYLFLDISPSIMQQYF